MIIDGKKIASEIQVELKEAITNLGGRPPCLAVILVGENPASEIYVRRKTRACKEVGIRSLKIELPTAISEEELLHEINTLNKNPEIDGILLQLPLPDHMTPSKIISSIDPSKDVDGFHPINVGKMLVGEESGFIPCTPLGISIMMERSGIEVSGKHVLVIGRSNIVGKPMAALLMQRGLRGDATVTVAHSRTKNIKELSLAADIIIVAIGKSRYLTADMVKDGAVVIDVGINKVEDTEVERGYHLAGDVDFDAVKERCSFITPVPGGVGPMTIAMLLNNTLESYRRREVLVSK